MKLREKTEIILGQGEDALAVTVYEILPIHAPALYRLTVRIGAGLVRGEDALDAVESWVLDGWPEKIELMTACTSLGDVCKDLGWLEAEKLWVAFQGVNAGFFAQVGGQLIRERLLAEAAPTPPTSPKTSTTPCTRS